MDTILCNDLFNFVNHVPADRFYFDLPHLRLLVRLGTHLNRLHDIRESDLPYREDLLDTLANPVYGPEDHAEFLEYLALLGMIEEARLKHR